MKAFFIILLMSFWTAPIYTQKNNKSIRKFVEVTKNKPQLKNNSLSIINGNQSLLKGNQTKIIGNQRKKLNSILPTTSNISQVFLSSTKNKKQQTKTRNKHDANDNPAPKIPDYQPLSTQEDHVWIEIIETEIRRVKWLMSIDRDLWGEEYHTPVKLNFEIERNKNTSFIYYINHGYTFITT